jgi:hypothetical protein
MKESIINSLLSFLIVGFPAIFSGTIAFLVMTALALYSSKGHVGEILTDEKKYRIFIIGCIFMFMSYEFAIKNELDIILSRINTCSHSQGDK